MGLTSFVLVGVAGFFSIMLIVAAAAIWVLGRAFTKAFQQ